MISTEVQPLSIKLSYEEFLQKHIDTHAEWIDGDVITFNSASDRHQDLLGWFISILSIFVETYELGWVRSAPFNMYLPHLKRGREPDILFVYKARQDIVQQLYLSEAADLVIEIASQESIGRDRGDKFVEYEAAGIKEYWLIDPEREQAEFYHLDPETNRYRLATLDEEGKFHSKILTRFWLQVDWLWQEELPKVLVTVQKLGLLD